MTDNTMNLSSKNESTEAQPAVTRADRLYEQLKRVQEAKGFFFNKDTQMVKDLLEQLLVIKDRYGYMACPCRIANGIYEQDKDILCPCVYRAPDVEEYGVCYCGLYVSRERNNRPDPGVFVPERRPPENIFR